jgi:hypothetical protein
VSNAAFITDESNCDQNQHHDENDALFVFRKLENAEQAFHLAWGNFGMALPLDRLHLFIRICHVERSETSLAALCARNLEDDQRFFALLGMTEQVAFHFLA